jgi:hypothetical protein
MKCLRVTLVPTSYQRTSIAENSSSSNRACLRLGRHDLCDFLQWTIYNDINQRFLCTSHKCSLLDILKTSTRPACSHGMRNPVDMSDAALSGGNHCDRVRRMDVISVILISNPMAVGVSSRSHRRDIHGAVRSLPFSDCRVYMTAYVCRIKYGYYQCMTFGVGRSLAARKGSAE